MAIECERWQWRELFASKHGPADSGTRLVLFVLALHMNQEGGNAFPSQETIAKRSGLSVRSVRRHLDAAAKADWLRISQKARPGKSWFVHEYLAVIPDKLKELYASKPWEEDSEWRRADKLSARGTPKLDKPGASMAYKTSKPGAAHPAILSKEADKHDSTPGNPVHNTRSGCPTNTPDNSRINSPCEGAALSRRTAIGEPGLTRIGRNAEPQATMQADKVIPARAERIRAVLIDREFTQSSDHEIAKIAGVTPAEVRAIRGARNAHAD